MLRKRSVFCRKKRPLYETRRSDDRTDRQTKTAVPLPPPTSSQPSNSVQPIDLFRRQLHLVRIEILLQARLGAGADNGNHGRRVLHQPGQHDLVHGYGRFLGKRFQNSQLAPFHRVIVIFRLVSSLEWRGLRCRIFRPKAPNRPRLSLFFVLANSKT